PCSGRSLAGARPARRRSAGVHRSGNGHDQSWCAIDGGSEIIFKPLSRHCAMRTAMGALDSWERKGQGGLLASTDGIFCDLPIEPICVRVPVAVKLTGMIRSTLYELIGNGEIEAVKVVVRPP